MGWPKAGGCGGCSVPVPTLSPIAPSPLCPGAARRVGAPLISAKGSNGSDCNYLSLNYFFQEMPSFLLLSIYIYIYGKTSYFCCALKFRAASPRQRCPSHKGSPPHIQPCFQQIFLSRRVFSSKFHVLVVVFCWMLSSEPSGGGFLLLPSPFPPVGARGPAGSHCPPLALSLCVPAPLPVLSHHFALFRAQSARIAARCPHSCDEIWLWGHTHPEPQGEHPRMAPSLCRCGPRCSAQCGVLGSTEATPLRVGPWGPPVPNTPRPFVALPQSLFSSLCSASPWGWARGPSGGAGNA